MIGSVKPILKFDTVRVTCGDSVQIIPIASKKIYTQVDTLPVSVVFGGNPQFEAQITQDLNNHIDDNTNPHAVTASQLPDDQDLTLLFNNALL